MEKLVSGVGLAATEAISRVSWIKEFFIFKRIELMALVKNDWSCWYLWMNTELMKHKLQYQEEVHTHTHIYV